MLIAELRSERHDLAHRVVQQVDIGGVMHIGFNHEGIAAPTQRFAVFFFDQDMPGIDHDQIDLVQ